MNKPSRNELAFALESLTTLANQMADTLYAVARERALDYDLRDLNSEFYAMRERLVRLAADSFKPSRADRFRKRLARVFYDPKT